MSLMLGLFRRKKARRLSLSVLELCGDGFCAVAGESHYQDAIRATRASCTDTFEGRPAFTAALVPEPDNPYDENAIAVYSAHGKLGYIPRGRAAEYRGLFVEVADRGYRGGGCGAHITGGEPGQYLGVVLRLADADACFDDLDG